jgi:hypothetical protein
MTVGAVSFEHGWLFVLHYWNRRSENAKPGRSNEGCGRLWFFSPWNIGSLFSGYVLRSLAHSGSVMFLAVGYMSLSLDKIAEGFVDLLIRDGEGPLFRWSFNKVQVRCGVLGAISRDVMRVGT